MMEKNNVMIVTSVASMIGQFLMPDIQLLLEMGYSVDVATNFFHGSTCPDTAVRSLKVKLASMGVGCVQVSFERNVFWFGNARAFWELEKAFRRKEYAFVHCHSPVGGILGRIVANGHATKIIYTAHGFHFYTGAPPLNWLLYYPAEKALSHLTDVLITINREDYRRAKKKLHSRYTVYIPGVGIDIGRFDGRGADRKAKRAELGIGEKDQMLLSIGELNKNKNHEIVINALGELLRDDRNAFRRAHFFIAGKGGQKERLLKQAKHLGVNLHLLGFRDDIPELLKAADLFLLPSEREGLNVSLMEAIAAECPVVCSDIRGNRDLVTDARCRFSPADVDSLKKILYRWKKGEFAENIRRNSANLKKFQRKEVERRLHRIYGQVCSELIFENE